MSACALNQIYWPEATGSQFTLLGQLENGPPSWYGSIIEGQQDASGFQYKRNRYYDPQSGRFTQEDPIGLAGGLNAYGFANGDPVNFSDPFGLTGCPEGQVGGIAGGACFNEAALLGIAITGALQTAEMGLQALRGALTTARTAELASNAEEIHGALHPVAWTMRTTAVLSTEDGEKIAAGSGRDNLSPGQRAVAAKLGAQTAKLSGADAEITALNHAQEMGLKPDALAVTRPICPTCAAAIRASGGTLTSPTTAVW